MEPIHTHISRRYNAELEDIRSRVLHMGGLVEQQIDQATDALVNADVALGESVIMTDTKVNEMEVTIDEECNQIIARRQPTASDLRLIVAVIKTITDLERIGDEAERIARMAVHLAQEQRPKNNYAEVQALGRHIRQMLHNALDAFARVDIDAALEVVRSDGHVHDGRSAHHLARAQRDLGGTLARAHRRSRAQHLRVHHLSRQGSRRASHQHRAD